MADEEKRRDPEKEPRSVRTERMANVLMDLYRQWVAEGRPMRDAPMDHA